MFDSNSHAELAVSSPRRRTPPRRGSLAGLLNLPRLDDISDLESENYSLFG